MNATRRQRYDDPRRNEQDYPHIVEMRVPSRGLGRRLDDMHDWHRARFLESRRGHGRSEAQAQEIVSYIRWCFKDPRDAEDFKAAFGGLMVAPKNRGRQVS
jgi:hypothetical protein